MILYPNSLFHPAGIYFTAEILAPVYCCVRWIILFRQMRDEIQVLQHSDEHKRQQQRPKYSNDEVAVMMTTKQAR